MPKVSRVAIPMAMLLVLTSNAAFAALAATDTAREDGGPGRRAAEEIYPLFAAGSRQNAVAASLSGKWCSLSNDSGVGRISGRCFTLHEDGTYEFYAETTSSGYYGPVLSRQSDSGAWSASDNFITANSSRSGTRTYSLQKRNHPQTGDPMLVIDGDAYLMYRQKRAW